MRAKYITYDRRNEWNAFVGREPFFALLQSWEWGEFKKKLGWKVYRIAVEEEGKILAGAQMLIKTLPLGLVSIAYIPRGPIGDWLEEKKASQLLARIHQVARKHRAVFLKIEPPLLYDSNTRQMLLQYNFRESSYTRQPRATLIIDLRGDLEGILEKMPRKTRYNIKYASRKGVEIRINSQEDVPAFYNLIRITGLRDGFPPRTWNYYEYKWQIFRENKQAALLAAYYQKQLLAARMVFCFGKNAADLYAASSNEFRNLRPNHLLIWQALKWAKANGCHTYDLWGIPDEVGQAAYEKRELPTTNRVEGLWGVYEFKRSFSKNVMFYIGAYDYVYSMPLYVLFTNRLFKSKIFEQISVWMDSLRLS